MDKSCICPLIVVKFIYIGSFCYRFVIPFTNVLISSRRTYFTWNMDDCTICGSKFPTRECYFCQRKICTSCVVPGDVTGSYSTTKCVTCDRRKINKISIVSVLKRNKFILGLVAAFWIYAVFPLPFLQLFGIKMESWTFQPIFLTAGAMTIPFVFMFFAWQKRSPARSTGPSNDE
jgi:hypothetical protein